MDSLAPYIFHGIHSPFVFSKLTYLHNSMVNKKLYNINNKAIIYPGIPDKVSMWTGMYFMYQGPG